MRATWLRCPGGFDVRPERAHREYLARLNACSFDPDSVVDQIALSRYANIEEELRRLLRKTEKAWHITYLLKWTAAQPGGQAYLDGLGDPEH